MADRPVASWLDRQVTWLILWTPIGRIGWVVDLHYYYLFGEWPPWRSHE